MKLWFKNHAAIRTPLSSFREFPNDVEQMATDHRWCGWPRIEDLAIKKCVNAVKIMYINSIFESPQCGKSTNNENYFE